MTSLTLELSQKRAEDSVALVGVVLKMHTHCDCKGYLRVYAPWFHRIDRKGWAKRADVVASSWFGRTLKQGEIVHHRDAKKQNDHPSNLEIIGYGDHSRLEVKARWEAGKMKGACKNGRWAKWHDCCKKCQTTERRHQGRGLCSLCYQRQFPSTK